MKTIKETIEFWKKNRGNREAIENQTDFALYSHCGTVGILCDLDCITIDKKGYEHYGLAFVPADDMEEVCVDMLNEEPHLTNDDAYSGYLGCCEIDIRDCRNPENEERELIGWWSDSWED